MGKRNSKQSNNGNHRNASKNFINQVSIPFNAKTDNQEKLYQAIQDNQITFAAGKPGCQPAGSKVLMNDGTWKNIEDIQIGDVVLSPQDDGTVVESNIIDTFVFQDRDIYEIEHVKGGKYLASHNHVIPVIDLKYETGKTHKTRRLIQYRKDITVDTYNSYGVNRRRDCKIFTTPAFELPAQIYTIHPYAMGAILGDGSVTGTGGVRPSFTYGNVSQDIITRFNELNLEMSKTFHKTETNHTVYFTGNTATLIRQSEIFGTNSHTKFIPQHYKIGSLGQRLELLAGLIDTDGSVDSFSSASLQLINDFSDLVHSVGGYCGTPKTRFTKSSKESDTWFKSYRVQYSFAEHRPNLMIKHKNQPIRDMSWKNPRNHSFKTKLVGNGTVYGFELDSQSKCYITDDYIVTHNTGKTHVASVSAVKMLQEGKIEKIIILRENCSAGFDIGHLPGSMEEKIEVAMAHIFEMFDDLVTDYVLEQWYEEGKIQIQSLAFLRGSNFKNSFILVDEAQNLNASLFYMLMTRIVDEKSKLVFCGDEAQCDLRKHHAPSGLRDALDKVKHFKGVGLVEFTIEDCVRSPLVKEIIRAYYGDDGSLQDSPKIEEIPQPESTTKKPRTPRKKKA